ncbi:sensor histidine kinase, partial [Dokdonella sp.]|uniref:sensor histidine kinase n=1 Tax=Dokdonella sp. TaxID=2291710 RepID=UPI003C3374A4
KAMLSEAVLGLGRSSTLVHGLCHLTRPDAEGVEATDVNQVMDAALGLLEPTWGERILVVKEYADLPRISCLPAHICRVFLHILENAAAAIEDRGRVSIHTRAGGVRNIEIRISDTGTGIANDVLPEVFEPFFSTRGESLGLGLSVAQGIVKMHGGTINLRSSAETGTSVIISLPIVAAAAVSNLPMAGKR